MIVKLDPALRPWCETDRQREVFDAVVLHGSNKKAAAALGLARRTVDKMIELIKARAAVAQVQPKRDYAPSVTSPRVGSGKRIIVIPDVQAKPGHDFSYLKRIGQYIVDKKPDRLVCLGDWADMPSLSSYDKGKKSFEGRRYKRDVTASHEAMSALLTPMVDYNEWAKANNVPPYEPDMDLLLGNHEDRTNRAVNDDPKLDGVLSIDDLQYKDFGWTVHEFLDVVVIEGIAFSHYFTTGLMGRPVTTAQACLAKKHMSCIQGHQQGLQIATGYRGDGQLLTSVIAGSCYEHDEDYMSSQGNKHWRGFLVLHDVHDGVFDLMPVSLSYINQKYPDIHVAPDYSKVPQPEGMR